MKDCSPSFEETLGVETLGGLINGGGDRVLAEILKCRREKVCGKLEKVARLNKRRKVAVLQLGPWTSNVFFAEKPLDNKL